LRVWDLESGRELSTLQGHTARVRACAVTPDGQRVVSASEDRTLKAWDLESGACLLTHRASVGYTTIAVTATTIIAGDLAGGFWILDGLPADRPEHAHRAAGGYEHPPTGSPSPRPPMKHTILFLAANPAGTDRLALDEECAAIERELRMTPARDDFEFGSR